MAAKAVPEGYHTVTPYLMVERADKLLEFIERVFDAKVIERMDRPDGLIGHAEVRLGDSVIMLGDVGGTRKLEAMPAALYLYVKDADATYRRALEAGAASIMEPADQFYGDRQGGVKDSWGNQWWIATHFEDVSPEEIIRRAEAAMKKQA
jgi:PhnB protein